MIPHDLSPRKLTLPETDTHTIALITGNALRHQRFAYRMQQEFGELLIAWYQIQPPSGLQRKQPTVNRLGTLLKRVMKGFSKQGLTVSRILRYLKIHGISGTLFKSLATGQELLNMLAYAFYQRQRPEEICEQRLFAREVEELRRSATINPIPIMKPNSQEFIAALQSVSPYFFLSLGGPLYTSEVLACCRGIALNQHAGWSPMYKGSHTTYWALYHRHLDSVGSTIHITTSGADAGPILRRSHPTLVYDDTPETCFARVVALGTELMIEVVKEIIAKKEIIVYDQPVHVGKTYRALELDRNIRQIIYRDFSQRWLAKELERIKDF